MRRIVRSGAVLHVCRDENRKRVFSAFGFHIVFLKVFISGVMILSGHTVSGILIHLI